MSSANWWPLCLCLSVLTLNLTWTHWRQSYRPLQDTGNYAAPVAVWGGMMKAKLGAMGGARGACWHPAWRQQLKGWACWQWVSGLSARVLAASAVVGMTGLAPRRSGIDMGEKRSPWGIPSTSFLNSSPLRLNASIDSLWPTDAIATYIWVNIGSGNGLLPDGTKPLPKPVLTYHQWGSVAFTWKQFYRKCSRNQSIKWVWKLHFWNYCHFFKDPKSKSTVCFFFFKRNKSWKLFPYQRQSCL